MGKRWFSLYVPRIPYREHSAEEVEAAAKRAMEFDPSTAEVIHGTDEHGECGCSDCGCGEKWPEDSVLDSGRGK